MIFHLFFFQKLRFNLEKSFSYILRLISQNSNVVVRKTAALDRLKDERNRFKKVWRKKQ